MMTLATILFLTSLFVFGGALLAAAVLFLGTSIRHVRASSSRRRASADFASAPPRARHA